MFYRDMFPMALHRVYLALAVLSALSSGIASQDRTEIVLWPGGAPGEKDELGPEKDTTKPTDGLVAGKAVIRLGNVSKPTATIFKAAIGSKPSSAIMVCPGGAYQTLAMDLEGTEVC